MLGLPPFLEHAKGLTRNPLGIIGLFIAFVYALAVATLTISGTTLDSGQRWVVVVFIATFPFVVLGAFIWLVSQHHEKLYSPRDYRSDDGFFRTMTADEVQSRVILELNDQAPAPKSMTSEKVPIPGRTDAHAIAEYQELEELAIRELECQLGASIQRHVLVRGMGCETVHLDGAVIGHDLFVGIEIKRVQGAELPVDVARAVIEAAKRFRTAVRNHRPGTTVGFIFAPVITDGDAQTEGRIWSMMSQLGKEHDFVIDVRPMWLEVLQRRFKSG